MIADDLIMVSIDDHVVEPPDMFLRHVPAKYKDEAPSSSPRTRGLVPPCKERAPSSEGGMCIGRSPDMTEPWRKPRRSDPPRGYPGERIG